ncbi:hypothetical protein, variant [Aphanomyces astaci]|uniref:Uncharacterized protein n=1 Tax=Aphanomyces astaci TaxID=112090 RepID=W4GLW9_APHAT|nr:hypothetical protein, variant [Aphanomyces astaci]ETV80657.1 hypothetical protein, variant [Aphanomyces astaci]|eukprot:XP_009829604.1 hypothetical protein, variant [Aphanomyces astaci]
MQKESKLRYDPSEHAKKQQAAKDRAKELRDARSRGVVNDTCTFTPKVNPRKAAEDNNDEPQQHAAPPGSPPIRSKFQATAAPPSPPIKSKFQNQESPRVESPPPASPPKRRAPVSNLKKPTPPPKMQANDSSDSLDRLSGSYSRQTNSKPSKESSIQQPYETEEPEHDSLSNELKTRTGKVIARESKPKASAGGGACSRDSSCRCRQCDPSNVVEAAPAPLARQRQMKPSPSAAVADTSTVDQNSLSLLKSKMSRRKSRSAPTKPASMFVDEDKPRQVVHSAREPPAVAQQAKPAVLEKRRPPPPVAAFEKPPANVFDGVPDGVTNPFFDIMQYQLGKAKCKTMVLTTNAPIATESSTLQPFSSIKKSAKRCFKGQRKCSTWRLPASKAQMSKNC